VQFGGYGSQVNLHDVGAPSAVHWFDDSEYAAGGGEDLGDGEVSADGSKIALVRSYGANTHIMWWRLGGDARSGTPSYGDPAAGCATGKQEGTDGPTWSPDGSRLAWHETNAGRSEIWVKDQADDCGVQPRLLIAGGSEPDWGPADVDPRPEKATLAVRRVKLASALKRGLKVTLKGAAPGKRVVTARRGRTVVARGSARVAAGGTATATLKFTAAARKALRKAARVKLAISGGGAKATVTLSR
jgi:hypothetical protein